MVLLFLPAFTTSWNLLFYACLCLSPPLECKVHENWELLCLFTTVSSICRTELLYSGMLSNYFWKRMGRILVLLRLWGTRETDHLGICSNADSSLRGLGWDPRFCISNKFSVSGSESSLGLKYLVVRQPPGNILDIQSHLYWFYFNYSLARNNGSFPEPALLGEERCLGSFQRLQNNEKMLTKEATAFKGAKFCWE